MRSLRHALVAAGLLFCLVPVAPAQDTARIGASLEGITGAADNNARREAIVGQLRALKIEPAIEPFGDGRGAGANVIVTLGRDAAKTIVVSDETATLRVPGTPDEQLPLGELIGRLAP